MRRIDLDKVGMMASTICAVHCFLTAVFLAIISVGAATSSAHSPFESVFIGLALLFGSLAAFSGYLKHRRVWPFGLFLLGIGMVLVSHSAFGHHASQRWQGSILSALGGCTLVGFHIANRFLQKTCCDKIVCNHEDSPKLTERY